MNITLYINDEPNNKINKTPKNPINLAGTLRGESNVLNPVILLETDAILPSYNYIYVADFGRYYFIANMEMVRTGVIKIECKIDVLKTYASDIMKQNVILSKSTTNGTYYLNHTNITGLCKETTNIVEFPTGLNDDGEFILITAGG